MLRAICTLCAFSGLARGITDDVSEASLIHLKSSESTDTSQTEKVEDRETEAYTSHFQTEDQEVQEKPNDYDYDYLVATERVGITHQECEEVKKPNDIVGTEEVEIVYGDGTRVAGLSIRYEDGTESVQRVTAAQPAPGDCELAGGTFVRGQLNGQDVNMKTACPSLDFTDTGFSFYAKVVKTDVQSYQRIFDFGGGSWSYNIFVALDVSSANGHGGNVAGNLEFRHIYATGNCDVSGDKCTKLDVPNFLALNVETEVLFTIDGIGAMNAYKKTASDAQWLHAGYTHEGGSMVNTFLPNALNRYVRPIPNQPRNRLLVGKDNWSGGQNWDGSMTDIKVWTRAITPAEL